MRRFFFVLIVGIVLITNYSLSNAQGYEIKVKIPSLKEKKVVLGHHFLDKLYPDDTITLDKKGLGAFHGKKALPGGMYIIFLPSTLYFDVIVDKQEKFTISSDSSNFIYTAKFEGSPENSLFYEYLRLIGEKRDSLERLKPLKDSARSEVEKVRISKRMEYLDKEVKDYQENLIRNNPETLLASIIKSFQEVQVPDFPKDASGKVLDSTFQYKYYKSHYFDNFDITDPRLIRIPVGYDKKILNYLDKMTAQFPDSLNKEIDMLIKKSRSSEELFRTSLVTIFNHYISSNIMGMDGVWTYVAEKYYIPEATWSDTAYISKLKKTVEKTKPLLLGKVAPDINLFQMPDNHFISAVEDTALRNAFIPGEQFTLHSVKAKFTVLVFWEAGCGHCKKAIPELFTDYKKLKDKGVQVVAVSILSYLEKKKWVEFVNEHGLYGWVNAWNPFEIKYKELYDVSSTPALFLLDEDKKIIAKKIGPEQLEDVINFELKKKKD
jgi:thiol-disulfide isomerase/thioredoxin